MPAFSLGATPGNTHFCFLSSQITISRNPNDPVLHKLKQDIGIRYEDVIVIKEGKPEYRNQVQRFKDGPKTIIHCLKCQSGLTCRLRNVHQTAPIVLFWGLQTYFIKPNTSLSTP